MAATLIGAVLALAALAAGLGASIGRASGATALPLTGAMQPLFRSGPGSAGPSAEETQRAADDQRKHDAWLRGDQARAERGSSRSQYRGLDRDHALATARGKYASLLDAQPVDPLPLRAGDRVQQLDQQSARIKFANGNSAVAVGTGPLFGRAAGRTDQPIDLRLGTIAGGFAPMNPVVDTSVPDSAGGQVRLGDFGFGLGAASDQRGVVHADKLFYANSDVDTDTLVRPLPTGLEVAYQLRSPQSPETLRMPFELPTGASLARPSDAPPDAAVEVVKDGQVLGKVSAPQAVDEQGQPVAVDYGVEGNDFTMRVAHRDKDYAYPIMVDPTVDVSYDWYDGKRSDINGWGYYKSNPSTQWCFGYLSGTQNGLYTWSLPNSSPCYANNTPISYSAGEVLEQNYYWQFWRRSTAYIYAVWESSKFAPPSGGGVCRYSGIYSLADGWESPHPGAPNNLCDPNAEGSNTSLYTLNYCAYGWYCDPSSVPPAKAPNYFVFGTQSTTAGQHPVWINYLGSATLFFNDNDPPTVDVGSGLPSGWVGTNATFTGHAHDAGVGIVSLSVNSDQGSNGGSWSAVANWSGNNTCGVDPTNQCGPDESVTGSTSSLTEGVDKIQVSASDVIKDTVNSSTCSNGSCQYVPIAHTTTQTLGQIKVDKQPPSAPALSGPLYDARTERTDQNPPTLNGDSYPMHIQAVDPGTGSGIQSVYVSVDGNQPTVIQGQCGSSGDCARTFDTNYTFDNFAYLPGTHRIDVWSTDQITGHVSPTVTFHVNTGPAANLSTTGQDLLQNDQLGLEKYYQYRTIDTGATSRLHVNLATGNGVWDDVPMVNPGQGLSTFVEITYNSQHRVGELELPGLEYDQVGQGFSLGISGPTRLNEPLDLTAANAPWPHSKITFTDIDGTRHIFMADPNDSSHQHYLEPPGVFLNLRKYSASDQTKTWAMTRPDGVTYFFDQGGYETSIQDRHHNTLTFKLQQRVPVCVGPACLEQVTDVTDQNGRSVHVGYNGSGQVSDITDHAGRDLHFDYANALGFANLTKMTQAYGTGDARAFSFCYGGGTSSTVPSGSSCGGQDAQPTVSSIPIAGNELTSTLIPPGLTQITDPNQNNTQITYCASGASCANSNPCPSSYSSSTLNTAGGAIGLLPKCVTAVTDRGGGNTTFGYGQDSNKNPTADVNGPRTVNGSRPDHWQDTMDGYGRPTDEVAPTSEPGANGRDTQLSWNGPSNPGSGPPNTLAQLVEAAGVSADQVTTTFSYDLNGRLTDRCGPAKTGESQCWRDVHIDYQHSAGRLMGDNSVDTGGQFVSDPTALTTARGQKYSFQLDPSTPADGLVTQTTDPAGKTWQTHYDTSAGHYADGHGLVTDQIDPLGHDTQYGYAVSGGQEPSGLPTSKKLPGATYSWHYRYDAVGNLLNTTDPRAHDPSALSQTTPFTTSFSYDNLDRPTDQWIPKDSQSGSYIHKQLTYDANGNLKSSQNASAPTGTDTKFTYDYLPMDWLKAEHTPAVAHADGSTASETTSYSYDEAGNRVDEQLPLGQGGGKGHETIWTYDGDNEPLVMNQTNPSGTDQLTSYFYDARGNVIGMADRAANAAGCPSNCGVSAAETNANPAGSAWRQRFAYDATNNKIETDTNRHVVNSDGSPNTSYDVARAQFDQDNNLIASEDPRGPSASVSGSEFDLSGTSYTARQSFDGRDLLTDSSEPSASGATGPMTHYDRQDDGKICAVTKPNGVSQSPQDCTSRGQFKTLYSYYAEGWLQNVTLPIAPNEYSYNGPMQISYGRDDYGLPTTITDPRGNSFTNTFYDTGALKKTGRPEWWTYDPRGTGTPGPDPNTDGQGGSNGGASGQSQADAQSGGGPGQVTADTPGAGLPIRERTSQELAGASKQRLDQKRPATDQQGKFGAVDPQPQPTLLPHAGTTSFDYDYQMQLSGITDQPGNHTSLVADALGRTTEIDQPFDSSTNPATLSKARFAYDEDGNLAQSTDPRGGVTTNSYDALDRLVATTAPGAASCPATAGDCANPNGTSEVTSYSYALNPTDGSGNPVRVHDVSDDRSVTATNETKITHGSSANSGEVTTDDYDASNQLISESHPQFQSGNDSAGLQTTYTYDGAGDQLTVTRPQGNATNGDRTAYSTTRTFDGSKHVTAVTVMDGTDARTASYEYDGDGNMKKMTAPGAQSSASDSSTPSQVTSYTYNGRDMRWATTTGSSAKTTRTTVTEYDPNGNLIRSVNAAGVNPSTGKPYFPYSGDYTAGQTTATDTNPNANVDATVRVYNDNDTQRTVYQPWGCNIPANDSSSRQCDPSQLQNAPRSREEFNPSSDGLDRTVSIGESYDWTKTASAPNKTSYSYFANGWIKQSTGPDGVTSSYGYDPAGDETSWTTTAGTTARTVRRGYWADGKVCARAKNGGDSTNCTDTNSSVDHYYYTPTQQLSEYTGQCSDGQSTLDARLRYDQADRITAVYGADATHNTGCGTGDGALKDTSYDYNLDGKVVTRQTDGAYAAATGDFYGGETATFHYDTLDRETKADVSPNVSGSQPSRHYSTSYWPSGSVEGRSRWQDGQDSNKITDASYYNDDGTLAEQTRSSDNKDQTYDYDADGNRSQSENGSHVYNALDQEVQWTRGDKQNQANSGTTVSYTLNGEGAITQTVDTAPIVTNQSKLSGSTTTTYTLQGDRTSKATTEVKTNDGTIDCTTTANYAYGDFGNVTSITPTAGSGTGCPTNTTPATTYGYDGFDRMTSAKGPDPKSDQTNPTTDNATYTYDPLDRRATRTEDRGSGGQTTYYSYMGLTTQLSREAGPDSGTKRTYDYTSDGQRLGLVRDDTDHPGGVLTTFGKDANGSVEALEDPTKSQGNQVDDTNRYHYTPYGDLEKGITQGADDPSKGAQTPEQALGSDAQSNDIRFDSFYYDSGVKTYDELSRNYRPDAAQFTTQDHFEQALGDQELAADPLTQSRYAYAGGNPTSDVEYDGHYAGDTQGDRYAPGVNQYRDANGDYHRTTYNPNGTPQETVIAYTNGQTTVYPGSGTSAPQLSPVVRAQVSLVEVAWRLQGTPVSGAQDLALKTDPALRAQALAAVLPGVDKALAARESLPFQLQAAYDRLISEAQHYDIATFFSRFGQALGNELTDPKQVALAIIPFGIGKFARAIAEFATAAGAGEGTLEAGTSLARELGGEAERLVQGTGNTTRIPSATGTAAYRIPDILNPEAGVIGEVKNVGSLSYTSQLRDFAAYAEAHGYQFDLYVRPTTQISGPLRSAVASGQIELEYLPYGGR